MEGLYASGIDAGGLSTLNQHDHKIFVNQLDRILASSWMRRNFVPLIDLTGYSLSRTMESTFPSIA